jgi:hypothetical protein
MPHLPLPHRQTVDVGGPRTGAELNYAISALVRDFLEHRKGAPGKDGELRYEDYAEALAALVGATDEFKRLKMQPYEDLKIMQNGSAYDA